MAAAPQKGTAIFIGKSGIRYNKSVYLPDVVGSLVCWGVGGVASATSPQYFQSPEPVVLRDLIMVADVTDARNLEPARNGVATGDIITTTNHLASVVFRPGLMIPFGALQQIQLIHRAT